MPDRTSVLAAASVERFHCDVRLRWLSVAEVQHVTPAMLRVTFSGDDVADFGRRGFDDHVKLTFPQPGGAV